MTIACPNGHKPMAKLEKFYVCGTCGHTIPLADLLQVEHLPSFLALPWMAFEREQHPRVRLHRLVDCVELTTRFLVAIAFAEWRALHSGVPLPKELAAKLQEHKIGRPSFGDWANILQALVSRLDVTAPLVVPQLLDFVKNHLFPLLDTDKLIRFRNNLVHGGSLAFNDMDAYLKRYEPRLQALLRELSFFADINICYLEGQSARRLVGNKAVGEEYVLPTEMRDILMPLDGHVVLLHGQYWLDLWPLCDYGIARSSSILGFRQACVAGPLLYQRLDRKRLEYTAFDVNVSYDERSDTAIVAYFRDYFQLDAQAKTAHAKDFDFEEDFISDSQALAGREKELKIAESTLKKAGQGIFWMGGPAGSGKSYLVASLTQSRKLNSDRKKLKRIAWRFKAGDITHGNSLSFLQFAIRELIKWLDKKDWETGKTRAELEKQFDNLLDELGRMPKAARRVLFILDGIDEIARIDPLFPQRILSWGRNRANVLWLCAGRPENGCETVFAADQCQHLFPDGLRMSNDDIHEMLVKGTRSHWYDLLKLDNANEIFALIVERAAGLPIFVDLVIKDILHQEFYWANLPNKLPPSLNQYYYNLLHRFAISELQALLTPLVVALVWAHEPLDEQTLLLLMERRTAIAGDNYPSLRRGLDAVQSIIRVVTREDGRVGYIPYHDSFRQYIKEDQENIIGDQNKKTKEAYCDLILSWNNLPTGHSARLYALRHGARTLYEASEFEKLWRLIAFSQDGFLQAQYGISTGPAAVLESFRLATLAAFQVNQAELGFGIYLDLLRHHQLIQEENPLAALRSGSIERAHSMAKMQPDFTGRTLWQLLLAWELQESGHPDKVTELFSKLSQQSLAKLSKHEWLDQLAGFLLGRACDEFDGTAAEISRQTLDIPGLLRLLTERIRCNDGSGAVKVVALLPGEDREYELDKLAEKLLSAGRVDDAQCLAGLAIWTDAKRHELIIDIAKAHAQNGNATEAMQLLNRLGDFEDRDRTVAELVRSISKTSVREALPLILQINSSSWIQHARLDILAALLREQDFDAAHQLIQECTDSEDLVELKQRIALAYAEMGDWQTALTHFDYRKEKHRFYGNPDYCGAVARIGVGQIFAGQQADGLATIQEARELVAKLSQGDQPLALAAISVCQQLAGFAEAAQLTFSEARRIADEYDSEYQTSQLYATLLRWQARSGLFDAAIVTIETYIALFSRHTMLYHIIEPLGTLINALLYKGDHESIGRILAIFNDKDYPSYQVHHIYEIVVRGCVRLKRWDLAWEHVLQCSGLIPWMLAQKAEEDLEGALAYLGRFNDAEWFIGFLLDLSPAIIAAERGCHIREWVSAVLMDHYNCAGPEEALINTVFSISQELLQTGKPEQAEEGFREVVCAAQDAQLPVNLFFRQRAELLARLGFASDAAALLDCIQDPSAAAEGWLDLCYSQLRAGEESIFSEALMKVGHNIPQLENLKARIGLLEKFARLLHRTGRVQSAHQALRDAIAVAPDLPESREVWEALLSLAEQQANLGSEPLAFGKTFKSAAAFAEAAYEERYLGRPLAKIALAQHLAGDETRARVILERLYVLTDKLPKHQFELLQTLALMGKEDEALNFLPKMVFSDAEQHQKCVTELVYVLLNKKYWERAAVFANLLADASVRQKLITEVSAKKQLYGDWDALITHILDIDNTTVTHCHLKLVSLALEAHQDLDFDYGLLHKIYSKLDTILDGPTKENADKAKTDGIFIQGFYMPNLTRYYQNEGTDPLNKLYAEYWTVKGLFDCFACPEAGLGTLKRAEEIVVQLQDSVLRCAGVIRLSGVHAISGFMEDARRLLDVGEKTSNEIADVALRVKVLLGISEIRMRIGDTERITALNSEMSSLCRQINDEIEKAELLGDIAAAQLRWGFYEAASLTVSEIPADRDKILTSLVKEVGDEKNNEGLVTLMFSCADSWSAGLEVFSSLARYGTSDTVLLMRVLIHWMKAVKLMQAQSIEPAMD